MGDARMTSPRRADVLALIPARGGSKGVPRKNLRPVAGHPLVAYSIAAAQASKQIDRVVVTTDDPEIAEVARAYGADVPFMRPASLSADDTPDLPVFQHALLWLAEEEHCEPQLIVHLRPTSPLRAAGDIDRAIELLRDRPDADAVRAVCEPFQNPYKMWREGQDGYLEPLLTAAGIADAYNRPRQTLPAVFWQTASIDVTRRRTVLQLNSMTGSKILPLFLPDDSWVDIDSELMIEFASFLVSARPGSVAEPVRRAR
jgi:N-acylneuraminate cytidylyltransferase